MDRWIALVDMDAFFASVEQFRNHRDLIGRPVCVGHDPKGGTGRGVVRAASYEARRHGIRSGMPVSQAYRLCSDATFIQGDFDDYLKASDEVMSVLAGFADDRRVRRASIDEAYIELTAQVQGTGRPHELALAIQQAVDERTQLPCSIGVAPSMSVAKIACKMKKPRGITVVDQDPDAVKRFLAPLDVDMLGGVGPKTAEHLRSHGIETLGQIQSMSVPDLWPVFGRGSAWLHQRACGIDDRPLVDNGHRARQSISKDWTFPEDVEPDANEYLVSAIGKMCDRIGDKVNSKSLCYRTVTVKLRYDDYSTVQRSRSMPVETDSKELLTRTAVDLMEAHRDSERPVRLLGVKVSGLVEKSGQCVLSEFM